MNLQWTRALLPSAYADRQTGIPARNKNKNKKVKEKKEMNLTLITVFRTCIGICILPCDSKTIRVVFSGKRLTLLINQFLTSTV